MTKLELEILDWLHREKPTSEGGGPYKYREIADHIGCSSVTVGLYAHRLLTPQERFDRMERKREARVGQRRGKRTYGGNHAVILDWLSREKPEGGKYNFTEIGAEVGLTRERIRQIAKQYGIIGNERIKADTQERRLKWKFSKGIKPKRFPFLVRRWLALIEHGYCCQCYAAKPIGEMTKGKLALCKVCTSANVCEWYRKDPSKQKRWRQANPDKAAAASRRWRKKHPEKFRECMKRWRKENPEKVREQSRAYYRRKVEQDPEGMRAKWREKYLRAKEHKQAAQ